MSKSQNAFSLLHYSSDGSTAKNDEQQQPCSASARPRRRHEQLPSAARCVLSSCYELSLSSVEAKELSSVAVSQKCSHRSIGQQQLTTTMTKARNEGLKLQSSSSVTRSTRFLTTSIPRLHANNCTLLIDSQLYLLASCPACPAFALACKQQPSTYDMSTWNTYWSVGTPQRLL